MKIEQIVPKEADTFSSPSGEESDGWQEKAP